MRDHQSFAAYAEELDARLQAGPAGDSDPALAFWLEEIGRRWPGARYLVVSRDLDNSRDALVAAAPGHESVITERWPLYLRAFMSACDHLRTKGDNVARFIKVADLADNDTLREVMEFCTGTKPSEVWARRMQRLVVKSVVEPLECSLVPPPPTQIDFSAGNTPVEAAGLTAAEYRHADFEMVNRWWEVHTGRLLPQTALPPLGVVVSHHGEPWAAVWIYESYGVPVAELTFPVTRPGLSLADATRALLYGVLACMAAAGKAHKPEAKFSVFKCVAPKPMIRYLKRLGFEEYLTERIPMILNLQN